MQQRVMLKIRTCNQPPRVQLILPSQFNVIFGAGLFNPVSVGCSSDVASAMFQRLLGIQ